MTVADVWVHWLCVLCLACLPSCVLACLDRRVVRSPSGSVCPGGLEDPIASPGYYPQSRDSFVACAPVEACLGGVNASAIASSDVTGAVSCADHYTGPLCALCSPGSYRLKGGCAQCPNTAWLLFLLFSVAIVVLVGIAVYISKMKINLAGLGIGIDFLQVWHVTVVAVVG